MRITTLLFFCLFCTLNTTAQVQHAVAPNTADPASSEPNNVHFAYPNANGTPQNKLFLFFPGTGGTPFFYRYILKHAAGLGYHAIGLSYPNEQSINETCIDVADSTCHSRARLEVLTGENLHAVIEVDSNNCIERRTLKLLQYLDNNFPGENWGQFFAGNAILWNKVLVSGHSQGGGHAGIISKLYEVDRVIQFAATDWVAPLSRVADWITWSGPTPDDRYYGFIHQMDQSINLPLQLFTWDQYGMDAFGDAILVDDLDFPYNESHKLYTGITPSGDPTQYHGSVVTDVYTPIDGNGDPVLAEVWTYLLSYQPGVSSSQKEVTSGTLIYPNPFEQTIQLTGAKDLVYFELYDALGRKIAHGQPTDQMDFPGLVSGAYLLRLWDESGTSTVYNLVKK
jgi:hypothetical protein